MSQTTEIINYSDKNGEDFDLTEHVLASKIIPEKVRSALEVSKSQPEVQQVCDAYMSEQLALIGQVEEQVKFIAKLAESGVMERKIEMPISEEDVTRLVAEIVAKVKGSEVHQALSILKSEIDEIGQRLNRLEQFLNSPSRNDEGLDEAARENDVKYNRVWGRLKSDYRRDVRNKLAQERNSLRDHLASIRDEHSKLLNRGIPTEELHRDEFKVPKLDRSEVAEYPALVEREYQKYCDEAIAAIGNDEQILDFLSRIEDGRLEEEAVRTVSVALRQRFSLTIGDSLDMAPIVARELGVPIYREEDPRVKVLFSLTGAVHMTANQVLTEPSWASYLAAEDLALLGRLNQLSVGVNRVVSEYAPRMGMMDRRLREPVDLVAQLANAVREFGTSIDSTNQLYFHSTPVLDRIIRSGALMPRVKVPAEERYTNTGEHSKNIHWDKEEIVHAGYSLADVERGTQSNAKEDISGVVAPLGVIVRHAPYRLESVLQLAGREHGERAEIGSDSIFMATEEGDKGLDYEIPLYEMYVYCSSREAPHYQQLLNQAGYTDDWVSGHMVVYPDSYLADKHAYRRVMAMISRTIRPSIEPNLVVPVRSSVVANSVELLGDTNTDSNWISPYTEQHAGNEKLVSERLDRLVVVELNGVG